MSPDPDRSNSFAAAKKPQRPETATGPGGSHKYLNESSDSGAEALHNEQNAPAGAATSIPADEQGKKVELTEEDVWDELGFSFPSWKKWTILTIIFLVQTSMNFNTSLYSNGLKGISEQFGVSMQAARAGAAIFLITYAFGCELWAPWSEEFGRKPVLQLSLGLVNIWCLPVALAPNFASLLVGRALGGLSSAGGSVTLGMVADIFESDNQQYAVAYIVFSSVGGSILGPIIGGFIEAYLDWRWTIWIQLIFGGFVQLLHLFFVPETRTTVLLDRIAKKRRASGKFPNVYGPNELEPFLERFTFKELIHTWVRPFRMFLTEPIVLSLSLLSGFSDALIFMQIQSFTLVYEQWGFSTVALGLAFIPIGVGYIISWLSFIPAIRRNQAERRNKPGDDHAQYESRLWWLLWTAPFLPIGLIVFAWTSGGPPVHWIGSMVGSAVIGVANYAIYMATIDYMICAYGPYSASATGGNGWSRDFLAGVLTVPATPFYTNVGRTGRHLQDANTILFCIACLLVGAVYAVYFCGPALRKRSPFAESLAAASAAAGGHRPEGAAGTGDASRVEAQAQEAPSLQPRRRVSHLSGLEFPMGYGSRRTSSVSIARAGGGGEEVEGGGGVGGGGPRLGSLSGRSSGSTVPLTPGAEERHVGHLGEMGPPTRRHQEDLRARMDDERRRNELLREATREV